MGRKKQRGFEWVRDDVEGEAIERVERPNRSADRRRRRQVEGLAKQLAAMTTGNLKQLPLTAEILEAIADYAATRPTPDRRRRLLRLKTMLVDLDDALLDELRSQIR